MVCLDTTFLIDVLRGNADAEQFLRARQDETTAVSVAAPSVVELVENAVIARSPAERQRVSTLLSGMAILPLDAAAAWRAGDLSAELILRGEQIGWTDTLIAAIALEHDEPILSPDWRTGHSECHGIQPLFAAWHGHQARTERVRHSLNRIESRFSARIQKPSDWEHGSNAKTISEHP